MCMRRRTIMRQYETSSSSNNPLSGVTPFDANDAALQQAGEAICDYNNIQIQAGQAARDAIRKMR